VVTESNQSQWCEARMEGERMIVVIIVDSGREAGGRMVLWSGRRLDDRGTHATTPHTQKLKVTRTS
jgi:hypothetical protein